MIHCWEPEWIQTNDSGQAICNKCLHFLYSKRLYNNRTQVWDVKLKHREGVLRHEIVKKFEL